MDRTSLSDAVFGSLPTELFQEIASYLTDPRDLAAFVNCCKTSLLALGKELIHIASAKEWAAAHAEKEALRLWDDSDYESSPPKATLVWASERCSDKDEFTWILNLYKKHYPKCLEYKGFRLDELEEPTFAFHYKNLPLEMAILHRNTTAVKVLLDQGVKIPKTARNWMLQAYPGETDFGSSWSFKDDYSPLGVAIQSHENLSMDIIRSLVDAGHYVTKMHIFQAVRMNNGDLYKLFLKQALESSKPEHRSSVLDVQYINEAIHYSRGGDCEMLDILIQSGVSVVDEDHAARLMENPYTCTLTELAIRLAHPQQALFLIRHQLRQIVPVPLHMRSVLDILSRGCLNEPPRLAYFAETLIIVIKEFHPELTAHLCSPETIGSGHDREWQEGCEFLISHVLQLFPASHEVVQYLLDNGCTMPAA